MFFSHILSVCNYIIFIKHLLVSFVFYNYYTGVISLHILSFRKNILNSVVASWNGMCHCSEDYSVFIHLKAINSKGNLGKKKRFIVIFTATFVRDVTRGTEKVRRMSENEKAEVKENHISKSIRCYLFIRGCSPFPNTSPSSSKT